MSLFNTAIHYNVYLDIPDDINFSWNYIYDNSVFDLESFIKQLDIKDDQSLIVLWGVDRRINVDDIRFTKLNEFYSNIKNPMVLFNGAVYPNWPGYIKVPYQQIEFFRYLSKISVVPTSPTVEGNKKFFFASTKDYLSRRYILQALINSGLEQQGYIAYKCVTKDHANESYDPINLKIIQDAGSSIDHLLPIQGFDDTIEYRDIPNNIFPDSYFSIITETFSTGPLYFSEKIFNAMLHNHFFVYFGPANSLGYLRSLGFQTWGHIIDESYDEIENLAERLYAVTRSLIDFLSKPLEEIQQIYQENLEIINHNRNLVLSTEINDTIVSTMRSAIAVKNQLCGLV